MPLNSADYPSTGDAGDADADRQEAQFAKSGAGTDGASKVGVEETVVDYNGQEYGEVEYVDVDDYEVDGDGWGEEEEEDGAWGGGGAVGGNKDDDDGWDEDDGWEHEIDGKDGEEPFYYEYVDPNWNEEDHVSPATNLEATKKDEKKGKEDGKKEGQVENAYKKVVAEKLKTNHQTNKEEKKYAKENDDHRGRDKELGKDTQGITTPTASTTTNATPKQPVVSTTQTTTDKDTMTTTVYDGATEKPNGDKKLKQSNKSKKSQKPESKTTNFRNKSETEPNRNSKKENVPDVVDKRSRAMEKEAAPDEKFEYYDENKKAIAKGIEEESLSPGPMEEKNGVWEWGEDYVVEDNSLLVN